MRTETIQIQLQGKATGAVLQTYFMDASKELLNSTRQRSGGGTACHTVKCHGLTGSRASLFLCSGCLSPGTA